MKREAGDRRYPLWLLGDSEPANWSDLIDDPLDHRHPARHDIWTPVLEVIQERLYVSAGLRLDARRMFTRNSVKEPTSKPTDPRQDPATWGETARAELAVYAGLVAEFRPLAVFAFGRFAYQFGVRALGEPAFLPGKGRSETAQLGEEFRRRVAAFDPARTNLLPLLHRSIAGRSFLVSHEEFCGRKGADYFVEAGQAVADLLLRHLPGDAWARAGVGAPAIRAVG